MTSMQAQLQQAARLFFDRLPPPVQQQLRQTFRSMDADGNGRISLAELIRWFRTTAVSNPAATTILESALPAVFAFVDSDGNGTLDFDECKGLFFIGCTQSRTCDGCAKLLLESAYTCADCSVVNSVINIGTTFDLCSSCYAIFMNPLPFLARNPKLIHPHRNMVEQRSELADAIDDMIDQVQCAVCKEYHRSNARGLFIQRHVQVGRGPHERTVCEWCIACLCPGCGNHFQGLREAASPGRWASQNHVTCIPCRQRGIMGPSPFNPSPFSPETLMKMDNSPVFEECRTCKAKAKDGSLMTTVLRTIITPRGGTFGTANPYNMFGSNSFGHSPQFQMPSFNPMGNNFGSSNFSIPNFNTTGSFGGGSGNSFDGFMQMAGYNNGGMGSSTGSPFDMLNMVNNMGGMGSSTGNPLDMLNMVSSMGNPLDLVNMVSMCSIM